MERLRTDGCWVEAPIAGDRQKDLRSWVQPITRSQIGWLGGPGNLRIFGHSFEEHSMGGPCVRPHISSMQTLPILARLVFELTRLPPGTPGAFPRTPLWGRGQLSAWSHITGSQDGTPIAGQGLERETKA